MSELQNNNQARSEYSQGVTVLTVSESKQKVTKKQCTKCGGVQPIDGFFNDKAKKDGHDPWCKVCRRAKSKTFYTNNAAKVIAYSKVWHKNNPDKVKASKKTYYINNTAKVKAGLKAHYEKNRSRIKAYSKAWAADHPEKVKAYLTKRRSTPKGRLSHHIASAIRSAIKPGIKAGRHWEELVDYTVDQLKKHLEKQFTDKMSWENYGKHWHIDHIVPIDAHNYETPECKDFKRCWALKNLRPLEKTANIKKSNKLLKPFQPSFKGF